MPANEKPPNCCPVNPPLRENRPQMFTKLFFFHMVTEEMDCFTYPTNVQATVSFFQLRGKNRLADLGLDQKGNFFKSYMGLLKTHTTTTQHNPTTQEETLSWATDRILFPLHSIPQEGRGLIQSKKKKGKETENKEKR